MAKVTLNDLLQRLKRPSTASLGVLLIVGIAAGVLGWGAFNWSLELTNTESFCISCHEMRAFPYEEYRDSIHFANRSGVRATCPDCHVPKEWIFKVGRKVRATNELFHKAIGSIDTPEKFRDRRLQLAMHEWVRMKKTDSRECRNCHDYDYMDFSEQGRRSASIHEVGFDEGKTCIDCHKGVAHALPPMNEEAINAELAAIVAD
jgi:cytochrome c-type protein NapC